MFDKKTSEFLLKNVIYIFLFTSQGYDGEMAYIATQGKKKLNSSNDKNHCLYALYQNELITLLTDTTLYIKCRC